MRGRSHWSYGWRYVLSKGLDSGTEETAEVELVRPKVAAAIPAFNEEVAIGSVVLKAKKHADEVIVIDDGSVDSTAEIAAMAGAKVLKHPRNLGKGAAIRTALDYAIVNGIDVLVLHDGDMQHDPDQIPEVIQPILDGTADVVIGTRWGKRNGMPFYRRVGKRVLDHATSWATGKSVLTDSQSGFRAMSRTALESLNPGSDGIGVESEMLIGAVENGLRIAEVPVDARYDVEGSTLNPARHGMSVLGTLITLISEKRPLFFFGVPGAAFTLVAAILAFHIAAVYYETGVFIIGYAFLFLLFAVVGVVAVFIGIVLNAMKKMIKVA